MGKDSRISKIQAHLDEVNRLKLLLCRSMFMFSASTGMYKRAAYICTGGEVKEIHDEGYGTIGGVFTARPKNCQYAVVVGANKTIYLVDMFELEVHTPGSKLNYKIERTPTFPSVEAAIMYAVATY